MNFIGSSKQEKKGGNWELKSETGAGRKHKFRNTKEKQRIAYRLKTTDETTVIRRRREG